MGHRLTGDLFWFCGNNMQIYKSTEALASRGLSQDTPSRGLIRVTFLFTASPPSPPRNAADNGMYRDVLAPPLFP